MEGDEELQRGSGMPDVEVPHAAAALLEQVLALVDGQELTATSSERAFLVGALAAVRATPGS